MYESKLRRYTLKFMKWTKKYSNELDSLSFLWLFQAFTHKYENTFSGKLKLFYVRIFIHK